MALGFMRRHRRWLYVFLWVVILGFIVFYIPAFRSADAGSPGEQVGRVGDSPITAGEFQRAYVQRRQLYERLYQGRLDATALRSLGLEEQVFESLVAERLIEGEALRLGLRVSDDELARGLTVAPDLQENGRFMGAAELKRRLQLGGQSVVDFEAARRSRMVAEKLETLVTAGVEVSAADVEREFRRRNEQVKLEYVLVDAAAFRSADQPGDAEIKERFDAHKESYRIPERRVVSYLLLDPAQFEARAGVSESDIESYYRERREEFRQEEEVCASHVLIKVTGPDAKEGHADEEAKKLAQAVLERVLGGADFAAIAKSQSEDKGSAPNGGELGCFGRGRMLPEFENAAFSLAVGETTSAPVRTSAGYHVIRVTSRREESYQPLAQVKERVRRLLTAERVSALVDEQAQTIATALAGGRSLADAAKPQALSVQKSQPLTRGEPTPPLASPRLVAHAFELKPGEVAKQRFDLPNGAAAFIALAEIQPAKLPDLGEVRERVKADLREQRALEQARARARAPPARGAGRPREGRRRAVAGAQGDTGAGRPWPTARGSRQRPRARGRGLLDAGESTFRPASRRGRLRGASGAGEEGLRRDGIRTREGPGRRLAVAGQAQPVLPSLPERAASPGRRGTPPGVVQEAHGLMHVEMRKAGEVVVIDLKGKLTAGLGDQILRESIDELLAENWKKILLNLSQVSFMDSAGVGELVAGLRTAKRFGADLRLLNASQRVHSTLYIARLLPIFAIYDNEAEALSGFTADA